MSFFPNGLPTQTKRQRFDNIDSYNTLEEIDEKEKIIDRIYFIRSENRYYRYDDILHEFKIAMDFDLIQGQIAIVQSSLGLELSETQNELFATKTLLQQTKVSLENDISTKVDKVTYNAKVSELESDISEKVNQIQYENKILEIENNIINLETEKLDKIIYDNKIEIIDNQITNAKQRITDLETDVVKKSYVDNKASDIMTTLTNNILIERVYVDSIKSEIDTEIQNINNEIDGLTLNKLNKTTYEDNKIITDNKITEIEELYATKDYLHNTILERFHVDNIDDKAYVDAVALTKLDNTAFHTYQTEINEFINTTNTTLSNVNSNINNLNEIKVNISDYNTNNNRLDTEINNINLSKVNLSDYYAYQGLIDNELHNLKDGKVDVTHFENETNLINTQLNNLNDIKLNISDFNIEKDLINNAINNLNETKVDLTDFSTFQHTVANDIEVANGITKQYVDDQVSTKQNIITSATDIQVNTVELTELIPTADNHAASKQYVDTKQALLSAGENIVITDNTISTKNHIQITGNFIGSHVSSNSITASGIVSLPKLNVYDEGPNNNIVIEKGNIKFYEGLALIQTIDRNTFNLFATKTDLETLVDTSELPDIKEDIITETLARLPDRELTAGNGITIATVEDSTSVAIDPAVVATVSSLETKQNKLTAGASISFSGNTINTIQNLRTTDTPTFSGIISTNAPTNDTHVATKKYVDDYVNDSEDGTKFYRVKNTPYTSFYNYSDQVNYPNYVMLPNGTYLFETFWKDATFKEPGTRWWVAGTSYISGSQNTTVSYTGSIPDYGQNIERRAITVTNLSGPYFTLDTWHPTTGLHHRLCTADVGGVATLLYFNSSNSNSTADTRLFYFRYIPEVDGYIVCGKIHGNTMVLNGNRPSDGRITARVYPDASWPAIFLYNVTKVVPYKTRNMTIGDNIYKFRADGFVEITNRATGTSNISDFTGGGTSGGTTTSTLPTDPSFNTVTVTGTVSQGTHAATKSYVDSQVTTINNSIAALPVRSLNASNYNENGITYNFNPKYFNATNNTWIKLPAWEHSRFHIDGQFCNYELFINNLAIPTGIGPTGAYYFRLQLPVNCNQYASSVVACMGYAGTTRIEYVDVSQIDLLMNTMFLLKTPTSTSALSNYLTYSDVMGKSLSLRLSVTYKHQGYYPSMFN